MDGYQAAQEIREVLKLDTLPIIAMTANAMTGDKERCLAAGMNEHISKPVDPDTLTETLLQWIQPTGQTPPKTLESDEQEEQSFNQNIDGHQNTSPPSLPEEYLWLQDIPGCELSRALHKLGEDPELMADLLQDFLLNYHDILPTLQNILDNMPEAEHSLRLVHTLKGLMGTFAFTQAEDAATQLEQAMKAGQPEHSLAAYQQLAQSLGPIQEFLLEQQNETF